ncbi:PREDICTED: E3 ubiquitin-protein ligase synoviolin A-like [Nicrophorus vespilloides]|uniref:RING-type E3 ubiquitin transferase n=2 Tax=Nicrophorus vespilloides TaxID=110193 RepID=A0ABM1M1E3_NICVS|nr:PREDICTED: E3 ubiquitin-protein ligase synoviolin A-like [Nicrophorus vespilloides]
MRSVGFSLLALCMTVSVVANAYYQKKQFYPSVVYITKSNPSMAVIYLQAFICVLLAGRVMRKVFFGQLRTTEFEHLMERSWYAITETCLAFTVFRDDFNPKFVSLFTLLLFLKSFHWLAEDRVDYMERSPVISYIFHLRVMALLLLLGSLDIYFVEHAYQLTVSKGASVQLVFGFEYAILFTMVINIIIKYTLYTVDLHSETPWDNKAVFLLYTELVMGLIKVILYIAFMFIMVRIYTLPLFALRPMYYTIRNFKKAFNDVILSRRAIHNMNTLYPDATLEELQAGDNVCIICREEMTVASKKLPCNHIFHASCLRSWFQRQQTCPTCRLNILRTPTAEQRPDPQRAPRPAVPNLRNVNFNIPNPFLMLNNNLRQQAAGLINQQQQQPQMPGGIPVPQPNLAGHHGIPPPGMIPFIPVPPIRFMQPPPMPPPNLSNLSPEQLRRMEGRERENVEARIQWLRNIQLMLDAANMMFQQYNTAAAISMSMQNNMAERADATPGTSSAGTSTSTQASPPTASSEPSEGGPSASASASSTPSVATSSATASSVSASSVATSAPVAASTSSASAAGSLTPPVVNSATDAAAASSSSVHNVKESMPSPSRNITVPVDKKSVNISEDISSSTHCPETVGKVSDTCPTTSKTLEPADISSSSSQQPGASSSTEESSPKTGDMEVRRRRLEKFQ